jgi:hypothetical protein
MQLEVVWSLLLQADSEGPSLIFRAAPHFQEILPWVRSWHTVIGIAAEAVPSAFQLLV